MKTRLGFQIHDDASRGRSAAIDEEAGGALVFGAKSAVRVQGKGVLPAHFVVLPHEGMLLAASKNARNPAYVNGQPLAKDWTVLELPCRVEAGTAAVDFLLLEHAAAAMQPHGMDELDCTRIGPPPVARRAPKHCSSHAPVVDEAPAQSFSMTGSIRTMKPREITLLAARRLRDDYARLSRPKRLLAPVAVLLMVLSLMPTRAEAAGSSELELAPVRSDAAFAALTANVAQPAAATTGAAAAPAVAAAPASPGAGTLLGSAPAAVPAPNGLLPPARSLPAPGAAKLSARERVVYHKAIEATLAGDFATAFRFYDQLSQAHPEATEIKAAQRVLAAKMKR